MEVVNIKTLLIVILLVLNIHIYRKIFYFIFRDSDDFRESVRYSFTPDIFSLLRGRYWKDQMGELKLSIFIVACIAVVFLEYLVIGSLLNVFFN